MKEFLAIAFPETSRGEYRSVKHAVWNRERSQPHYLRKFYHAVMGLICFSLYAFVLTTDQALFLLATIGGGWMLLDLVRFRVPAVNRAALRIFGNLMRREELHSLTANSFYVLGMATVVLAFPKPIALLAVLYLALGDPAAAIVGTRWGRRRIGIGNKSVEGMAANGFVCFVATFLVGLFLFHLQIDKAFALAVLGSSAAMIAEVIPMPLDDNFTLPVISAMLLSVALLLVPIL